MQNACTRIYKNIFMMTYTRMHMLRNTCTCAVTRCICTFKARSHIYYHAYKFFIYLATNSKLLLSLLLLSLSLPSPLSGPPSLLYAFKLRLQSGAEKPMHTHTHAHTHTHTHTNIYIHMHTNTYGLISRECKRGAKKSLSFPKNCILQRIHVSIPTASCSTQVNKRCNARLNNSSNNSHISMVTCAEQEWRGACLLSDPIFSI